MFALHWLAVKIHLATTHLNLRSYPIRPLYASPLSTHPALKYNPIAATLSASTDNSRPLICGHACNAAAGSACKQALPNPRPC